MNKYERYGDYSQQGGGQTSTQSDKLTAVKYLVLGMGIGAAVALLFAPMSGADCRDAIRRGYRTTLDGISEQTRNLRQKGSNLLGFGKKASGS